MDSFEDVPSFDFVIPLRPFERQLLEGIQRTYSSVIDHALKNFQSIRVGDPVTAEFQRPSDGKEKAFENDDLMVEIFGDTIGGLIDTLFRGWNEYRDIQAHFTTVGGEKILRDRTGAQTRADIDAIRELERSGNTGIQRTFGQKMLYEYNTSFFDHFVAEPLPRINFIPAASDISHWETLGGMVMAGHYTHLAEVIRDSDARFDIWKVVHQFALSRRRPDNGPNVYEQFMLSPAFQTQFMLEPASDEQDSDDEIFLILDRHSISVLEEAENDLEANFGDDEFTSAWESQQLSDDPRSYIEIIPWDELEQTTTENLEKGGVDIFLPYTSNSSKDGLAAMPKWMLWEPPSNNFFDFHALHVDDEVYDYCVINDWHFPGHLLGNRIVLAASPLEATEFVANLRHFWDHWNDCALAIDSSHQLYLLETIPGRQYRMRQKFQDFTSTSLYFCNLVEQHARPTDSNAKLRAIMGSDYKSKYQSMLRYIPPEQFLHVDTDVLGEGQNGAVYGAIWKRPKPLLCLVQALEAPFAGPGLPVVLKKVKSKSGDSGRIKKVLHELDTTFTAIGGCSIGCVKFLGITFLIKEFESVALSSHLSNGEKELLLVFERASEGNLFDFMERKLDGASETESWTVVLDTLSSIARGLANLHDHGIIHGDLHPKNILVTKLFYPDGPSEDSMEYDVLLSDFGEGKHLGDSDQDLMSASGNFACAIGDYMPKEVGEEGGWSAKADVFCFGRIAEMMLRIRVIICTIEGSKDELAIPTTLKSMLEKCLADNAEERPQMSPIAQQLDDLCSQIEDGEAEWTTTDMPNKVTRRHSSFSTSELCFSGPLSLGK